MANDLTGPVRIINATGLVTTGTFRIGTLVWSGAANTNTLVIYNKDDTNDATFKTLFNLTANTGQLSFVIPVNQTFNGFYVKTIGGGTVAIYGN